MQYMEKNQKEKNDQKRTLSMIKNITKYQRKF